MMFANSFFSEGPRPRVRATCGPSAFPLPRRANWFLQGMTGPQRKPLDRMMMQAHPKFPLPPPPIRVGLDRLLATEKHITIGEIVDRIDERGFGLLMLVLGLPMLIPILPPGASTLVGPLYSLLALRNDDGIFLLAGLAVGVMVIGIFSATVGLIVAALRRLFPWWFPPGP